MASGKLATTQVVRTGEYGSTATARCDDARQGGNWPTGRAAPCAGSVRSGLPSRPRDHGTTPRMSEKDNGSPPAGGGTARRVRGRTGRGRVVGQTDRASGTSWRVEAEARRRAVGGDPDWTREARLDRAVVLSVQQFQVGESGDGANLVRAAEAAGDTDYAAAVRYFVAEEQNHARFLASLLACGRSADDPAALDRCGVRTTPAGRWGCGWNCWC